MDDDLWARARPIFEQAVDEAPEVRAAFVTERCAGDAALADAVARLLQGDAREAGVLDGRAGAWVAEAVLARGEAAWMGRRLGPYRVTGVLGRGGMGTVFEAARDDEHFEQRVALKVMRGSLGGPEARLRFLQERQILARLEHPSIARLLDGGETGDGVPWLAMERVDGQPIAAWCDARRLPLAGRIRLLAAVCDVVAYAHAHLVVHRDLKPGNVLVDAAGRPRLVDFGVAKLLDLPPGANLTRDWQRILTPDYASPEQVAGRAVTTSTDVYSLGVMLCELLAGRPPFSWTGLTPEEVRHRLERDLPPEPSRLLRAAPDAAAVAAARASTVSELYRRLAGDLDRIALMALRPQTSERYASVAAFADDLRRFLAGLPVQASGSDWFYRARTFARRHRVALAAGALAVAGLVAFAATATWEARRAERERRRAEAVTTLLVGAFADADPEHNRGDVATAREVLDRGAARLLAAGSDDPLVTAELSRTVGSVYVSLGLYAQATPLLGRAAAAAAAGGDDATTAAVLQAQAELSLGEGALVPAREQAEQAVAAWRRAHAPEAVLAAERLLAKVLAAAGRRGEAADLLGRVLVAQETSAGAGGAEALRTRLELARTEMNRGDAARAEIVLRTAHARRDPASALGAEIDGALATALLRLRRAGEAEPLARGALEASRRIWGARHPKVADAVQLVGSIAWEQGRTAEAQAAFTDALEMRRALLGPRHPALASALYDVAFALHREWKRPDLAEPLYREAVEVFEAGMKAGINPSLGVYLRGWGRALTDTGRAAEAEGVLRRALDLFVHHAAGHDARADVASTQSDLAAALAALGRSGEAIALLTTAEPVLVESYGADHRITRRATALLATLRAKRG
jgi:serine/threonine-protein kinase